MVLYFLALQESGRHGCFIRGEQPSGGLIYPSVKRRYLWIQLRVPHQTRIGWFQVFQVIFADSPETGDPQYIAGRSYGESCTLQVTIGFLWGRRPSFIRGSFVDESFALYSIDDQGYRESLGNFRLEGTFRMRRSGDLYLYTLSYNAMGVNVDDCPDTSDLPKGANVYVNSFDNESVDGYSFMGWNTEMKRVRYNLPAW